SSSRQRSAAAQASSGWAVRFASLTSRIADNRIDWSGLEFPGADSASAASLRTHGLAQYTGGRANPCLEWPDQLTSRRRASGSQERPVRRRSDCFVESALRSWFGRTAPRREHRGKRPQQLKREG